MSLSAFKQSVFACAILFLTEDLSNFAAGDKLSGRYDVVVKTLESCPDDYKYKVHFGRRLSRYNRTTLTYTHTAYMPYDFDDSWQTDIKVALYGNGGYKDNFYNVHFDKFCTFLVKVFPNEVRRLVENIKAKTFCPLKAGTYNIKNYVVKFGEVDIFPVLPYGSYRIELISSKTFENGTNVVMSCFRSIVDVVPKKP